MDRGQGSIKSKNFPARQVLHIWKAKCNFSTLISSKLLIVCMTVVVLSLAWIFTQKAYVVLVLEEKGFFFRVKIDLSRRHGQMKEEWLTSHGKYLKSALPAFYFSTMQRLWNMELSHFPPRTNSPWFVTLRFLYRPHTRRKQITSRPMPYVMYIILKCFVGIMWATCNKPIRIVGRIGRACWMHWPTF